MKTIIEGCEGTLRFGLKTNKYYEVGDSFPFDKRRLKLLKWLMKLAGAKFTYEDAPKPRKSRKPWLDPPKSHRILVTIVSLPAAEPRIYQNWMTVMMMHPDNFRAPKPISKARQRIDAICFANLQEKCFTAACQNGSLTGRYYEDS